MDNRQLVRLIDFRLTHPDPADLREFTHSLPEAYRDRFDAGVIASHARVSNARADSPVNIGRFETAGDTTAICVVADDRPGLLSMISAALVRAGLDVADAEAYCRRRADGRTEAVDLFWLRRRAGDGRVADAEIDAARAVLTDLIVGKEDDTVGDAPAAPPQAGEATLVRFLENSDGGLAVLEVETSDRSGLLHAVTRALFHQRVQIVRSEVRTVGTRVLDRFQIVEFDGAPIGDGRRLDVQVAVMTAIGESESR